MSFNSLQYAAFLPVVVAGFWLLRGRSQRWWLLVASWCFYAAWDWRFLSLLWISTITDYLVGRAMDEVVNPRVRGR